MLFVIVLFTLSVGVGHCQIFNCSTETELLFQCADGKTCIKRRTSFCNGTAECPDGSDEYVFDASMEAERGMKCRFLRREENVSCHFPDRYKCDHELDCVGGADECGCRHTFECANGDCTIKVTFCDGTPHCNDGTDEKKYNRTTKIGFQCPVTSTHVTNRCVLPDKYLCDGDSDCDNGIDECFCDFSSGKGVYLNDTFSNDKCFRCLDGTLVIPNKHVCDGVVHCQDLSDECLCSNKKNYSMPDICNSVCNGDGCTCNGYARCLPKNKPPGSLEQICLDPASICDNNIDCYNRTDELYCPISDQDFWCYDNKTKIRKDQVCNGHQDCADGSDENFCKQITDYYCIYYRGRDQFSFIEDWENETQTNDNRLAIPPGRTISSDFPLFGWRCDGVPLCAQLDDECYAPGCDEPRPGFCNFVPALGEAFKCINSGSIIIGREVCDGKPSCNDTHPAMSDDELYCPNRFYCANRGSTRLPVHLPLSSECNGIQECDDQSDELNCSEVSHFYCKDDGEKKFIRSSEVCDGTMDCVSGTDECQKCNPSPFSDDQKLISSRVLVGFLWIIGLVAVIGNLAVMGHQMKNLIKPQGKPSSVATINRILVLNLSMADVLVGIYLVGLGIKDAMVDRYCLFDPEWRASSTCWGLGTIALIGTEASVFMISIMTAYRLYLVVRPFKTEQQVVIKVSVVAAWCLAFLVALLPHAASLNDYFVSCVWYRNNKFFGFICRNDLERFVKELYKRSELSGKFSVISDGASWNNMFAAVQELNSSYVPERYFGYYSAHSVCLPRLFPDRKQDLSWGYSLFLILLNFFAFVFILTSYIHIYRVTTMRTGVNKAKAEGRATALQRKVARIVATDFCCWMPICIMALVKVSGVYVSDLAYAVTAVILLPINAAMNPFLYSDVLDLIWEKMMPVRVWCAATSCGQHFEQKMGERRARAETSDSGVTKITRAQTLQQTSSSQNASSVEKVNESETRTNLNVDESKL